MNILILSASTGGGHMRASKAIESYLLQQDKSNNVKIIDSLLYINPIFNKTVTNGYVYLATKTPKLYGKLYEYTNKDSKMNNFVSKMNKFFSGRLLPLIEEYKPDIIISTHPFSTEMVSILKGKGVVNIPLLCIMTDYAPHKAWIKENVDSYIVSNDDMVEQMVNEGVEREKIYPFGIPIDEVFFKEKDREQVLVEAELDPKLPTLLMMAGSFGVSKVFSIYENIIKSDLDFQIILITGKNKKLYEAFKLIVNESNKRTKLIYFTDEVNKYMQASDIIITKPGGLTVTEALACNIPMALFGAIPGQEEENAEFLIKHNMAIDISNKKDCSNIVNELLINQNKLKSMREACKSFDKNNSSENISLLINKLVKNN